MMYVPINPLELHLNHLKNELTTYGHNLDVINAIYAIEFELQGNMSLAMQFYARSSHPIALAQMPLHSSTFSFADPVNQQPIYHPSSRYNDTPLFNHYRETKPPSSHLSWYPATTTHNSSSHSPQNPTTTHHDSHHATYTHHSPTPLSFPETPPSIDRSFKEDAHIQDRSERYFATKQRPITAEATKDSDKIPSQAEPMPKYTTADQISQPTVHSLLKKSVKRLVTKLNERQKNILCCLYRGVGTQTQVEVASHLGLCYSHFTSTLGRLRKHHKLVLWPNLTPLGQQVTEEILRDKTKSKVTKKVIEAMKAMEAANASMPIPTTTVVPTSSVMPELIHPIQRNLLILRSVSEKKTSQNNDEVQQTHDNEYSESNVKRRMGLKFLSN